jgi:hypothetical protein
MMIKRIINPLIIRLKFWKVKKSSKTKKSSKSKKNSCGIYLAFLGVFFGFILSFCVAPIIDFFEDKNPATLIYYDHSISIYNKDGKFIYHKDLPLLIWKAWVVDANKNGENEILIATSIDKKDPKENKQDYLILYNKDLDSIIWTADLWKEEIPQRIYEEYNYDYSSSCRILEVVFDSSNVRGKVDNVIVWTADNVYANSCINVISMKDGHKAEFWHRGGGNNLILDDINFDGKKELIFSGINNSIVKEINIDKYYKFWPSDSYPKIVASISLDSILLYEKSLGYPLKGVDGVPMLIGDWYCFIPGEKIDDVKLKKMKSEYINDLKSITLEIVTHDGIIYCFSDTYKLTEVRYGDEYYRHHTYNDSFPIPLLVIDSLEEIAVETDVRKNLDSLRFKYFKVD